MIIVHRVSKVIREPLRLLRDKQTGSRLQVLRDILTEGLISSEPATWGKGAFPKKLKLARGLPVKTVKLTLKACQALEDTWYYGYKHFGEEQVLIQIFGVFQVMGDNNI
ncbi:hypothetical protein ACGXOO_002915 [Salmonella enterica subsp. enterica serovar Braenderup]|nr:putative transcriptional regulators, containing the CopG/Arc/MetJ DNA-binding domain protein [Salmonella enterica subsp. enterica serovar Braenderup]